MGSISCCEQARQGACDHAHRGGREPCAPLKCDCGAPRIPPGAATSAIPRAEHLGAHVRRRCASARPHDDRNANRQASCRRRRKCSRAARGFLVEAKTHRSRRPCQNVTSKRGRSAASAHTSVTLARLQMLPQACVVAIRRHERPSDPRPPPGLGSRARRSAPLNSRLQSPTSRTRSCGCKSKSDNAQRVRARVGGSMQT